MGRNSTPKLDERREGKLYRFRHPDETPVLSANDGHMIVYEMVTQSGTQILATAWADGLQTVMAEMWESGYRKGLSAGSEAAKEEIRRSLGACAALKQGGE
ncbi:hypothetical protein V5F77_05460 [Xanthobacter sp. DSM 24535]|uniref:hypothetical protein n=1 Tax=Roseixanthobacter psychrophilus TaxID=3119917 RepID=UPI0037272F2A